MNSKLTNVPLDVKVVGLVVFIDSCLYLLFGLILATGIGYSRETVASPAIFGIFMLYSDKYAGIYLILHGMIGITSSYFIVRMLLAGWWMQLLVSLNILFDTMPKFLEYPIRSSLCICVYFGIIIWLFYRRKFYKAHFQEIKFQ